jgi:hypothetical protein
MTPTLRPLPLPFPRVAFAAALILLALAGCQAAEEFASEGTEVAPIDLASLTAWEGQVGPQPESSYYTRTAGIDTTYAVLLSGLVNDAILVVFQDAFTGTQLCVGLNLGSTVVSCSATTGNPATALYIRVLSYSEDGTEYVLTVNP